MLTLSSLIFYVISYKLSLNNIYIASHLHVEKDSWILLKLQFLINIKYTNIQKFECFWDVSNITQLLEKHWGWNKIYYEIKRPFMKVMLLNEIVKHALFKPNFDIEILFNSF